MDQYKMNTRLGIFSLIASIVLMSVFIPFPFSYAQIDQTQQEWLTYEDPILGISIQYPKGWEAEESPDALTLRIINESGVPIASSII